MDSSKPGHGFVKPEKKQLSERSKTRLKRPETSQKNTNRRAAIPADKQLRVIGHQLKPCLLISENSLSDEGLTDQVVAEAKARLEDHELIKVKIRLLDREDRDQVLSLLLEATGARLVHKIGKAALLLKPSHQFSAKLSNIERHRQLL